MKKAQGLPITTIIIAILAIVVLFIIIGLTTGKLRMFGAGTQNATQGEVCTNIVSVDKCDSPLIGNYVRPDGSPLKYNEVCCA
ncbi:MAG: hypothetical protein QXM31_02905 [Candidatus Woesearchaeota archaeon]